MIILISNCKQTIKYASTFFSLFITSKFQSIYIYESFLVMSTKLYKAHLFITRLVGWTILWTTSP